MEYNRSLQPDIKELVLCQSEQLCCETYVFEPSPHEASLGYLFVAGEIQKNNSAGQELLDEVVSAIQKEYYRDPSRSVTSSFESALHQANLILHETAQNGQRDWMDYFNVSVAVMERDSLHVSVAGEGNVLIARSKMITNVSLELAHFPISDPINTFSQVASGNIAPGDMVFLGTTGLMRTFTTDELSDLSANRSAVNTANQMYVDYRDKEQLAPLAAIVISVLPQHVLAEVKDTTSLPNATKRASASVTPDQIKPRQPLEIKRSNVKNLLVAAGGLLAAGWRKLWPVLKKGSVQGGQKLYNISRKTKQNMSGRLNKDSISVIKRLPSKINLSQARSFPQAIWEKITEILGSLPRTSKIFAVLTIILIIALITSLVFLQKKRTDDEAIQQANEILHQAETKKEAADMALIYNNREQARIMLADAEELLNQLENPDMYVERRQNLVNEIKGQYDRLQKITRADETATRELGDFGSVITQKNPSYLFMANENLYTFNPENNAIVKMDKEGNVKNASSNTQGIGFFSTGTTHTADKTIILASEDGNIAIFDTKDDTLRKQEISFSGDEPKIKSISVFGNRLYAYDTTGGNVFSLNKTLRGFAGSTPWITDENFAKNDIVSIAVDGNVFTLHEDGSVHRLFKGQPAEFTAESLEPHLAGATRLITTENMRYIYIVDPPNRRVVIYTKNGALVRQILMDSASVMSDAAIGPQEKKLYVLDGTKVLEVSLEE